MKKINILSKIAIFLLIVILFNSCSFLTLGYFTEKTHEKLIKKEAEPYTVNYELPIISPLPETPQTQIKGGVTITCEILPFNVEIKEHSEETPTLADPNMSGFDIFEVKHTPYPEITPEQFKLNIKIKNNQDRILKVRETALLLQVDGITYHIPEAKLVDWYAGMIIKNGEFNYSIEGPQFSSLANAKLIYLFINDVPTIMDEGGNIKKRENFEWYFECKQKPVSVQNQITYTYENRPIHREKCSKCSGTGTDPQAYKCNSCNGTGEHYNKYTGKTSTCSTCDGKGVVYNKCPNCGGLGERSYQQSKQPSVTSSNMWQYGDIQVVTNPPGAKISVIDYKTKNYKNMGTSNSTVTWYSSSDVAYPIFVEYMNKIVKVYPYDKNGNAINKVEVDFNMNPPYVKKGQDVSNSTNPKWLENNQSDNSPGEFENEPSQGGQNNQNPGLKGPPNPFKRN